MCSSKFLTEATSLECIKSSIQCGCYYCCSIFNSSEAEIDEDFNYIGCPNCGIDSVIGDFFGFKITETKLKKLRNRQFYPILNTSYEIPDIGTQLNEDSDVAMKKSE